MLRMRSCWCHAHYNYQDFFIYPDNFFFLQRGPDNGGSTVVIPLEVRTIRIIACKVYWQSIHAI